MAFGVVLVWKNCRLFHMNHNDTGWMTMTEDDRSGAFKGPRKLCFSWPSKQRHLENTLRVKGNEKLDHVNCANI